MEAHGRCSFAGRGAPSAPRDSRRKRTAQQTRSIKTGGARGAPPERRALNRGVVADTRGGQKHARGHARWSGNHHGNTPQVAARAGTSRANAGEAHRCGRARWCGNRRDHDNNRDRQPGRAVAALSGAPQGARRRWCGISRRNERRRTDAPRRVIRYLPGSIAATTKKHVAGTPADHKKARAGNKKPCRQHKKTMPPTANFPPFTTKNTLQCMTPTTPTQQNHVLQHPQNTPPPTTNHGVVFAVFITKTTIFTRRPPQNMPCRQHKTHHQHSFFSIFLVHNTGQVSWGTRHSHHKKKLWLKQPARETP